MAARAGQGQAQPWPAKALPGAPWPGLAPKGASGRADKTEETLCLIAPLLCGALFCLAGAAHGGSAVRLT